MKSKLFDIILWIITIVFIGIMLVLPNTIPIHWRLNGQIDQYGSK